MRSHKIKPKFRIREFFANVVCVGVLTPILLLASGAGDTAHAALWDTQDAAEMACLDVFNSWNRPGKVQGLARTLSEANQALHRQWVDDMLKRQDSDGKFCYGFKESKFGGVSDKWNYSMGSGCQPTWLPLDAAGKSTRAPERDFTKFPIVRASPRLTAVKMVRGGSANGDFPMLGAILTPHETHYLTFEISRDERFSSVIYSGGQPLNQPACLYPDRLDVYLSRQSQTSENLAAWGAASTWTPIVNLPSWLKGDVWIRITVSADGLGSDSIISSMFLPDGHGTSRYQMPHQSPAVVDISVNAEELLVTVTGSMDPFLKLTVCVEGIDRTSELKDRSSCHQMPFKSSSAQVGAPRVHTFNWRELLGHPEFEFEKEIRGIAQKFWTPAYEFPTSGKLVRVSTTVENPFGVDKLEYEVDSDLDTTDSVEKKPAKKNVTCRKKSTIRRFKGGKCPNGWKLFRVS